MIHRSDFISEEYLELNRHLHEQPRKYGQSGRKHVAEVLAMLGALDIHEVLDYGCGQGTFSEALANQKWRGVVHEYDPAVLGKDMLPDPAPMVICTDVLEHVEPDKLDAVLAHLHSLIEQVGFFAISTVPSSKFLRDGRNAHLMVQRPKWWRQQLGEHGFRIRSQFVRFAEDGPTDVHFWVSK